MFSRNVVGRGPSRTENAHAYMAQERRREAERTGRMIDLTADVSATVLAATAAKLEAEQTERDEAEVQKNVAAAVRPFQQKVVRVAWALSVFSCSL